MNQAPALHSERLILRKPEEGDIQDRFTCGRSAEVEKMCGRSTIDLQPYTYEEAKHWVERLMSKPLAWSIEYQGRCIGQARLIVNEIDRKARYAVGLFDESILGKGFGTEITQVVLHYAFSTLGLHRVELRVLEYNTRAIACYEKCGFVKEGLEREGALIDEKWFSDWRMSILEQEYFKEMK
ncbi:GNAT family N-acetyltransferase [Bacillus horti]|uniref:RimJ/RimL family protein N-acetyltransferase n=1 Tax=Caldalkalibacillus horti TaxID=77523 RepID=A0ABT9W688_9BACI|nr:GNAT family protein [Bacillus horti]MDQ0168360.1 RimJ/RimL family protein N-acetyltransferase [Bacillus horti]